MDWRCTLCLPSGVFTTNLPSGAPVKVDTIDLELNSEAEVMAVFTTVRDKIIDRCVVQYPNHLTTGVVTTGYKRSKITVKNNEANFRP